MVQRLATSPVLRAVGDLELVAPYIEHRSHPAGSVLVQEGDVGAEMYFVLGGEARIVSNGVEVGRLGVGDHFGELGLLAGRPRSASIVAITDVEVGLLARPRFEQLCADEPTAALLLLRRLVSNLGRWLSEMTTSVGLLLRERSAPRRADVRLRRGEQHITVRTGTRVGEVLPSEVDGHPVVGGLVDRRPVSLAEALTSDCRLDAMTTATTEGRSVYHDSLGLLLLEAARQLWPRANVRLEHGIGFGRRVAARGFGLPAPAAIAAALVERMGALVAEDRGLREEWWTVDEARHHFEEHGWTGAAELLRTWRDPAVPMASYGDVYAVPFGGPLLPDTAGLQGFQVLPDDDGLLLVYGRPDVTGGRPPERDVTEEAAGVSRHTRAMMRTHRAWLRALGATTVGELNRACVEGRVGDLIRVSEGFQEKRLSKIADRISVRDPAIKVICIAGPSSSGKTTFMKRLRVQLQVVGLHPVQLSLDDYYCDRYLTPRDADGALDYEHFDALRHDLLAEHLDRLLAGESVRTARYDFLTGTSEPAGGRALQLGARDVLMVEGIHGLNPRLVSSLEPKRVLRIFICPLAQLEFDRLSRVRASDLRLVRRIVRDRRWRGARAADNIQRWPSVRRGERRHIFPFQHHADEVFDSSLIYELSVLKVFAERYLLEVPHDHPSYTTAFRLLGLLDRFVTVHPEQVPATSLLREFIGDSAFED